MDEQIAALLRERAGYVVRGLTARVKACDEQLAALGYREKATAAPAPETAAADRPRRAKP